MAISEPLARRLMEAALAGNPELTADQLDDLIELATDDEVGITAGSLDAAVSVGWGFKAALVADQYDLGAGSGKTLDRSQWVAHCRAMALDYASGRVSATGQTQARRRGRSGSVAIVGALAQEVANE